MEPLKRLALAALTACTLGCGTACAEVITHVQRVEAVMQSGAANVPEPANVVLLGLGLAGLALACRSKG